MSKIGSPEWFREKARTPQRERFRNEIEEMRAAFIEHFSPERLSKLSGSDLLYHIFGNHENSMFYLLTDNQEYNNFGSCVGRFKHPILSKKDKTWIYQEKGGSISITTSEAKCKAEDVRDKLLECIHEITRIGSFSSLNQYDELDKALSRIWFSKYTWVLKYYQMLFPHIFPGMYSDPTLNRAINILGLPNHGTKRLLNVGEIALFIKRCDINNIIFNDIYGGEWTWGEKKESPCENSSENLRAASHSVDNDNLLHYRLPHLEITQREKDAAEAAKIDEEIDEHCLEGEYREAVVKVRVNQGKFRDILLHRYSKCCLCGISDPNLLTASHIKPWSESEPNEKLDVDNGFLLCPNHDKLFDKGFISFTDEGKIMISSSLSETDRIFTNVNPDLVIDLTTKNKVYLDYHRKNIFLR